MADTLPSLNLQERLGNLPWWKQSYEANLSRAISRGSTKPFNVGKAAYNWERAMYEIANSGPVGHLVSDIRRLEDDINRKRSMGGSSLPSPDEIRMMIGRAVNTYPEEDLRRFRNRMKRLSR